MRATDDDLFVRVTEALEEGGPCRMQDLADALDLTPEEAEQVEAWPGVVLQGRGWRAIVSLAVEDTRTDSRTIAAALVVLTRESARKLAGATEIAAFLGWSVSRVYRALGHATASWYVVRVERRGAGIAWMPCPVLVSSPAG